MEIKPLTCSRTDRPCAVEPSRGKAPRERFSHLMIFGGFTALGQQNSCASSFTVDKKSSKRSFIINGVD
jgi:hypothetical protein